MEFFRFVDRAFSPYQVVAFPEVGLDYLSRQQPPPDYPYAEFTTRVTELVQSLVATPVEIAVRQHIIKFLIQRIKEALEELGQNFVVLPCGSCLSGTFLPEADIDLVVYQYPVPCTPSQIMDLLEANFMDILIPGTWQPLAQAKVPVLKFTVEPGIQIDLTIDELHGPLGIPTVRQLFQTFPILLPTQLFLKCLLLIQKLDRPFSGGISSYTLQFMCLAYLQYKGEPECLADFICGLCNFYGNEFNFMLTGIDVKGNGRFFSRLKEDQMYLESPTTMCIVDPLNPGNVLGYNSFKMGAVKQMFRKTYEMIRGGKVAELFEQFAEVREVFQARRVAIAEYARKHNLTG
jgi:non-canonical poly(A) RNA polymerase PAPD5/7